MPSKGTSPYTAPRGFRRYRPPIAPFDWGVFGGIFAGLTFLGLTGLVFLQQLLYGYDILYGKPSMRWCGHPDIFTRSLPPPPWPVFDSLLNSWFGPPITEDQGMRFCVVLVVLLCLWAALLLERKKRECAVDQEIHERSVILAAAGTPGTPRVKCPTAQRGIASDGETRPMSA
jgi:hypothetical protein